MNKKILIIGNSAKEYSFAKILSKNYQVFVAPGNDAMKDFATCLDIREDSITELLDFAMENDIDLTVPISKNTLNSNIVDIFNNNGQKIFGPSQKSSEIVFDKMAIKKILYKLRIPTPKFGIFEKQNMALDYIKNLKPPFVIKSNEKSSAVTLTNLSTAKMILDIFFSQNNTKVLIEDYIWGTPFSFYVLTDGYNALPLGSSIVYKYSLDGDGGQLTSGMGACSPNYKLSTENEMFLMHEVAYPILNYLNSNDNTYLGILGINGILSEESKIQIIGFEPFMQDCDCKAIMNIIDTDIIPLIESCVIGSFSDDIEFIPLKDIFSTSIVLTCSNRDNKENSITGIENLDENIAIDFYPQIKKNKYLEYEAEKGSVMVLTATGRTVTSSINKLYEEIPNIEFKGLSYRKDICKAIIPNL